MVETVPAGPRELVGDLSVQYLNKVIVAHGEVTGYFLKALRAAIENVYGPGWNMQPEENLAVTFKDVQTAMWELLDGRFHKATYTTYFSVAKKCLKYGVENWGNARDTNEDILREAVCIVDTELERDTNGFYLIEDEQLTYEAAVWYQVKIIKQRAPRNNSRQHSFPQPKHYSDESEWIKDVVSFLGSYKERPDVQLILKNIEDSDVSDLGAFVSNALNEAFSLAPRKDRKY